MHELWISGWRESWTDGGYDGGGSPNLYQLYIYQQVGEPALCPGHTSRKCFAFHSNIDYWGIGRESIARDETTEIVMYDGQYFIQPPTVLYSACYCEGIHFFMLINASKQTKKKIVFLL